jgi:hypothetical protein
MITGVYSDGSPNRCQFMSNGPRLWREFTSKENVKRFERRVCAACKQNIHLHWRLPFKDVEMRSKKWCHRDGTSYSPSLAVEDI